MNEQDTGIKKETISFYPMETTTSKTVEIKFTLSGSSFKLQLLIFNQDNAQDFLHFLHEFNEARTKLGYNTCPKLESGLKHFLQVNDKNKWNKIKKTVSPNRNTIAAFNMRGYLPSRKYTYLIPPPLTSNVITCSGSERIIN